MEKRTFVLKVTNDTFHNGNADAWNHVLEAYREKYPMAKFIIIFNNEELQSPYQLYQWGRIFNGSQITFIVMGEHLGDFSLLKRLLQSASGRQFKQLLPQMPGWITPFFK